MKVLVAYESKHGSTEAIAERIAERLRARGLEVDAIRARNVSDTTPYDAFVIGSAVYYGSWLNEATEFVQRERAFLSTRPVWLFSSGPISPGTTDAQGRDLRAAAEPATLPELRASLAARDHHVFWGALDRSKLGFADRLVASMPAFPGAEGDFRDWHEIEAWAEEIAGRLAPDVVPAGAR